MTFILPNVPEQLKKPKLADLLSAMRPLGTTEFEAVGDYNGLYFSRPDNGYEYIKITRKESKVSVLRIPKCAGEIVELCGQTCTESDVDWSLHFLISKEGFVNAFALPFAEEEVEGLQKYWKMGLRCFSFPKAPKAMTYSPILGDSDWQGFRLTAGFVETFDLVISHDATNRRTFAIFKNSDEAFLKVVIDRLMAMKDEAFRPYLLILIFAEMYLQSLEAFTYDLWRDIVNTERYLGCNQYFNSLDTNYAPDITDMPASLASLLHATVCLSIAQESSAKQIEFVEGVLKSIPRVTNEDALVEMQDRLHLSHDRLEFLRLRCVHMRELAQSMMQMVYATLQQRDNEINHRYAANVNIITAITLIFLPGTFVATLFSSSFWNFGPQSDGPIVSNWVWLYFVLTAVLTIMVLGIWRGYTVLKQSIKTAKNVWGGKVVSTLLRRGTRKEDVESGGKVD